MAGLPGRGGEVGSSPGHRYTHSSQVRGTGHSVTLEQAPGLSLGRGGWLDTERMFKKIERI